MAASNSTPSTPCRIAVDRRALPALMARPQRVRPYQLTIETDPHGDTRAYLDGQRAQAVRS